jgi:Fur family ferric uptake transcriptional regulator
MERKTTQRQAIERVLEHASRPLAPREVCRAAQKRVPRLGVATVYRTLNRLLERGWLIPVSIPGEPARYELAGKEHHHHFYCRRCRRVYEVDGCPGQIRALTPKGFHLEGHELVLYGYCDDCRVRRRKRVRPRRG